MSISYRLFKGSVDKQLNVSYVYKFEASGDFQTIKERPNGNMSILPSFGISISQGFDKDRVYITSNQYYVFGSLLEKITKLISEHLYELFPNVGASEFEIDAKVLERFQTEKAVASDGITMSPCVWVDDTNQCFPGVQIVTLRMGSIRIPLQDAIPMSELFRSFDPHQFSISMLRIYGKIS